jgi:hypothetical protein
MPKISEMKESKFLKKDDVGAGVLVTFSSFVKKDVAAEGAPPEFKWCATFRELEKPLVMNITNAQICEQVFGSDDTDDWIGKQIVLYVDPNVSYGGKIVGGIRMRKPKNQAPKPVVRPAPEPFDDSDVPF